MKKILSVILAAVLIVSVFAGCSANSGGKDGKIKVVASIFPIYDWTKNIIGDDIHSELTLLLNNGADLHNYQPTADDIITISTCDIFIYVGGESDKWAKDTLSSAQNKNMKVVNLMELLGEKAKEEELVEGMQEEEEEEESDSGEAEYDEHVWLSLRNAQLFVTKITEALCDVDKKDAEIFKENAAEYNSKLANLDAEYIDAVNGASTKTLVFGDRFPFRYMTEDYGLDYYAAFVGCSAESEASFETVSFLSKKVDELALSCVIAIDSSDQKLAKTVIDNTKKKNQKILVLDSMQSITQSSVENGESYYSIMNSNLKVLREALS